MIRAAETIFPPAQHYATKLRTWVKLKALIIVGIFAMPECSILSGSTILTY
jgi:hypothetical protein